MFSLRILLLTSFPVGLTEGHDLTKKAFFRKEKQKYLTNHVMETRKAEDELTCALHCIGHDSCLCELNTETSPRTSGNDKRTNSEFIHLYIFKKVSKFGLFYLNKLGLMNPSG